MRFAVFCYDFPHWKTQNGLLALYVNGITPDVVVGAPWVKVSTKPSSLRIVQKDLFLVDTGTLCKRFGFNYVSAPHELYDFSGFDFGVILGARILKKKTLDPFQIGVLNIHPGILPHNRGLDNVKWAVLKGYPQGVTAHLVNEYVDSGRIINWYEIPIYRDDCLKDIQFRVQNKEIEVMAATVSDILNDNLHVIGEVQKDNSTFKCMGHQEEIAMLEKFTSYRDGWAR